MSTAPLRAPFDRYPLAREATIAVGLVAAFAVWSSTALEQAVRLTSGIDVDLWDAVGGSFAGQALLAGIVAIATMCLFAGVYVYARDFEVGITGIDGRVLAYAGGGLVAGAALVAAVKGVAVLSGGSLSAVSGTSVAAPPDLQVIATITLLGLFVTLPAYLLLTHVLVQRTLDRVADDRTVVALTAVLVGTVGPTELLQTTPFTAGLGFGLLAVAIALPVIAATVFDDDRMTAVTLVPLVGMFVLVVATTLPSLLAPTHAAYALAGAGVVAVGAAAYQRTRSLVPSALCLTAFYVGTTVLIVAFETGVGI